MVFIHDTEQNLRAAAYLVNTLPGYDDEDALSTLEDFEDYLRVNPYTGLIRRDDAELAAIRAVRPRLRQLWEVDRDGAVPLVAWMCQSNPSWMTRRGSAWPSRSITLTSGTAPSRSTSQSCRSRGRTARIVASSASSRRISPV